MTDAPRGPDAPVLAEAPPQLECFVCPHVLNGARPVGVIGRDEDGDFYAICGGCAPEMGGIVGLGGLVAQKPELAGLPIPAPGSCWTRPAPGAAWVLEVYGAGGGG